MKKFYDMRERELGEEYTKRADWEYGVVWFTLLTLLGLAILI